MWAQPQLTLGYIRFGLWARRLALASSAVVASNPDNRALTGFGAYSHEASRLRLADPTLDYASKETLHDQPAFVRMDHPVPSGPV